MIKNKKLIQYIFHSNSLFLLISIFALKVNAETEIVAKNGDTLFKLSKEYGISLKELMHKNDFNDANELIEGKVVIIPSRDLNKTKYIDDRLKYKVKEGDTIYGIAKRYKVTSKDIISQNNLDIASHLQLNQIILLPAGAIYPKESNQKKLKSATKKVFYHQKSKEEKLSDISKIHNIPVSEVIELNKFNTSLNFNSTTKVKIRESKSNKWIKYGPLSVNWSDWRYFNGNYITKANSKKNKSFFIAISCERRTLNNTLGNHSWKKWYFPGVDFEYSLINDFCDKDYNI